jgi:hypothetical protein
MVIASHIDESALNVFESLPELPHAVPMFVALAQVAG